MGIDPTVTRQRAELFQALHRQRDPLILPNAWDVMTARAFADCGFPAVGTTSFGIARAHGLKDGENAAFEVTLAMVGRMAAGLAVPLSVDMEGGFGATPEAVAHNARRLAAAGAVGFNIEDGQAHADRPLADPLLQADKIAALKALGGELGLQLFVNARVDVFWLAVGEAGARLDEALRRAEIYVRAGADGIFLPGLPGREEISRAVAAVAVPLNLLAGPQLPPVPELAALGVRRLSLGSGPARATLGLLRAIGEELRGPGTYHYLDGAPSYLAANQA